MELHLDTVNTLTCTERNGTVVSLTREAILTEVPVNMTAGRGWESLVTAINAAGVPQYGDRASDIEGSPGYELILQDRVPSILAGDNRTVSVKLQYEHGLQVEQQFDDPKFGPIIGEVKCNIQQKTGNRDINGNEVVLAHYYGSTSEVDGLDDAQSDYDAANLALDNAHAAYDADPSPENQAAITAAEEDVATASDALKAIGDAATPSETPGSGWKKQVGEFSYMEAQKSLVLSGIKETTTPWILANTITGTVNAVWFAHEPPRYWLCTACNWKPEGLHGGSHRYFMNFEFQFDKDTWDPQVIFIDEETGKPPIGLVPGIGYRKVNRLRATDYETLIGAPILG